MADAPDAARKKLERLLDGQASLRRVATLVAAGAEPARVFASVCAELGGALGVESTNLTRFEGDTQNVLAGWSIHGAPVFPTGDGVPLTGEAAAVAQVSRSGHAERIDDYSDVPGELAERVRAAGIASSVAVPIMLAGELWGAVVVSGGEPNCFPPGTERRVAGFADLVSLALANVDAREQLAASRARIVQAGDAERRRLERNLHDGAQQRLVALALQLRVLERTIESGGPQDARAQLAAAREELDLGLADLRDLAHGIHPAVLVEHGLGPAIESLAERCPLEARIESVPVAELPEPVGAAAYYVVAEALANSAKHAGAGLITVSVETDDGCARVRVCDDGRGGADLHRGTGLRGLADRVEAFGGSLKVDSPPGAGTTLVADIPLAG